MKLVVNLQDPRTIVTLSRWASVSRTFDAIRTALEDPDDIEAQQIALEEIEVLAPALDALHKAVQSQMWVNMCGQLLRKMHGFTNDIVCRLEEGHLGPCRG